MFESLIREAASRFNLGEDAPAFVRTLVDAIFDNDTGGFAGLRERFVNVGLGSQFASWIGGTPGDDALQPEQFAAGFGGNALGGIASKFGLPDSVVATAGAFLLPKLIGGLTPGGHVPDGVPGGMFGGLGGAMHGIGDSVRDFGGAAAGAAGAAVGAAGSALGTAGDAVRDAGGAAIGAVGAAGSAAGDALRGAGAGLERGVATATGGGWWKWLIAAVLLIGAFLLFRGCNKQETTDPAVDAAATAEPAADPAASGDPANADAMAGTDPATADAAATGDATAQAPATDDPASTAADTAATDADPNAAADSALSGIKSGASVDDVANALNMMIIHFATGSADISADSEAILVKAAAAIKTLPAGTKLEVGGHTDNTGNASANQSLSQRRADAVVARLGELGVAAGTLTGKGYGQDKPKASNDTAEGRAENRRIEFTAAQ